MATELFEIRFRRAEGGAFEAWQATRDTVTGVVSARAAIDPAAAAAAIGGENAALIAERDAALSDKLQAETERDTAIAERDAMMTELREWRRETPVTRAQFIAGLRHGGLFDAVNGFFAALADDTVLPDGTTGAEAKDRWAISLYFSPVEPLLLAIAKAPPFSLTDEALADLFAWARENA